MLAALGYGGGFAGIALLQLGALDETLVALLEEALRGLGEGDSVLRARLLARLGEAVYWTDTEQRRVSLSQEALEMAQRVGDPATLAFTLNGRSWALSGPDHVQERLAAANEMVRLGDEVGDQLGDRATAQLGLAWRTAILLELGDIAALERDMEAYSRAAAEVREPLMDWYVSLTRAMRALMDGRLEEAERLSQQAMATGQLLGSPTAPQAFGAQVTLTRMEQGRLGELKEAVRGFVEQYPALPVWRAALAFMYSELGAESEARSEFELLAANDFADLPRDSLWLTAATLLASVCAYLDDTERATRLYELLLPYAERNVSLPFGIGFLGSVSHYLGMLATALSRPEEAVQHFDRALEVLSRMGARPRAARTQQDYAAMLLRRGGAADKERALGLANETVDAAQEMGMTALMERALALKLRAQGIDPAAIMTSIDAVHATVQAERPDLRPHAAPDGTVTIMFSDIEGSTALNERLGDQRWMALLRAHNAVVREQVRAHGGFEVKSQGDGFMIAFGSARRALQCAIGIQRALAEQNETAGEPVRVRIGLHTGEAVREENDFYGRHVALASRIAGQARGGEVLVSSLLRELTQSGGEFTFDEGRELELKGLAGLHRLYTAGGVEAGS